jgi:hypothetical protein
VKQKSNWPLILGIGFALVMASATFWMYRDSEKSDKEKAVKKIVEKQQVAQEETTSAAAPSKFSGVFKNFLDNPLQSRGPAKQPQPPPLKKQKPVPVTFLLVGESEQPKESYYIDAK